MYIYSFSKLYKSSVFPWVKMARKKHDEEYSEEDVYAEEAREELLDDAEISPEEEAFMRGYEEADSEKKAESEDEEEIDE
jgi:hypothetical protein